MALTTPGRLCARRLLLEYHLFQFSLRSCNAMLARRRVCPRAQTYLRRDVSLPFAKAVARERKKAETTRYLWAICNLPISGE